MNIPLLILLVVTSLATIYASWLIFKPECRRLLVNWFALVPAWAFVIFLWVNLGEALWK